MPLASVSDVSSRTPQSSHPSASLRRRDRRNDGEQDPPSDLVCERSRQGLVQLLVACRVRGVLELWACDRCEHLFVTATVDREQLPARALLKRLGGSPEATGAFALAAHRRDTRQASERVRE